MENNVICHLARRAAEGGSTTLRFNYRGVGSSTIDLPRGVSLFEYWEDMEREHRYDQLVPDMLSAAGFLLLASGAQRWTLVGYSLGALLAGMAIHDIRPDRIVAISPPVGKVRLPTDYGGDIPKTFLFGDSDFAIDSEEFLKQFERLRGPKQFVCLQGADHFFRKLEERLYQSIRAIHA
jgi:alpha/beta superfamily hydrolase